MGILLDSTRMEARLPFDKLIRAKQALQHWLHRKSATLLELESLIGTLQFACRVVAPGTLIEWGIPQRHFHVIKLP